MKKIFESRSEFVKDKEERHFSREIDYGENWRSLSSRIGIYRISWVEATGEFYVRDKVSLKIYLMGRTASTEKEANKIMEGWRKKMHNSEPIESIFPEFVLVIREDRGQWRSKNSPENASECILEGRKEGSL